MWSSEKKANLLFYKGVTKRKATVLDEEESLASRKESLKKRRGKQKMKGEEMEQLEKILLVDFCDDLVNHIYNLLEEGGGEDDDLSPELLKFRQLHMKKLGILTWSKFETFRDQILDDFGDILFKLYNQITSHIRTQIQDRYDELIEMEEGGENAKISYTTERLEKLAAVAKDHLLYGFLRTSYAKEKTKPKFVDEINEIFDN